eukprot:COSAG02_NODE_6913_length_3291_cov_48.607143_1_plen_213_part_10
MHVDSEAATDAMLPLASMHIKEKTGFKVNLSYKEWKVLPEFESAIVAPDTVSATDFVHEQIAGRLVRCDDRVFFRDDTHRWYSDQRAAQRYITDAVSRLHIFSPKYVSMSRNYTEMTQISRRVFESAPEDLQFLPRMFTQTVGKLAFMDGYFDFQEGKFIAEPLDCMARVPRKFPERDEAVITEVHQRVLDPIFNGNHELKAGFLRFIARGLA